MDNDNPPQSEESKILQEMEVGIDTIGERGFFNNLHLNYNAKHRNNMYEIGLGDMTHDEMMKGSAGRENASSLYLSQTLRETSRTFDEVAEKLGILEEVEQLSTTMGEIAGRGGHDIERQKKEVQSRIFQLARQLYPKLRKMSYTHTDITG